MSYDYYIALFLDLSNYIRKNYSDIHNYAAYKETDIDENISSTVAALIKEVAPLGTITGEGAPYLISKTLLRQALIDNADLLARAAKAKSFGHTYGDYSNDQIIRSYLLPIVARAVVEELYDEEYFKENAEEDKDEEDVI